MAAPARLLAKTSVLLAALTHFTYIALIVILMIAGAGAPIPEDIPLIFSGYLCSEKHSPIKDLTRMVDTNGDGIKEEVPLNRHVPKLWLMIAAGMVGVLVGDSMIFNIGRHGIESNNLVARHLRKVMHSKRREKVERHFARHGNLTVLVGRFMPGFRSIVFAFAGLSKMSYFRFLLIDGLAAAVSVPAFILLGYACAGKITQLLSWIDRIKHLLLPPILLAFAIFIFLYFRRRRRSTEPVV
jgi:membrane protein DedA with SNARE-associated domain